MITGAQISYIGTTGKAVWTASAAPKTEKKGNPVTAKSVIAGLAEFRSGAEPKGFRWYDWGKPVSEFEDLEHIADSSIGGKKVSTYSMKNDGLRVGSITGGELEYIFCDGKFCGVDAHFADMETDDWGALVKDLFIQYGEVEELVLEGGPGYMWSGEKTFARLLNWYESASDCQLSIWSRLLMPVPTEPVGIFQYAVSLGNLDAIRSMLDADPSLAKATDSKGKGPLHWAIECHSAKRGVQTVELLISKGADVNTKDKEGYTPLYRATNFRYEELARLLVSKGADVNARCWHGQTALIAASYASKTSLAEFLVSKGADVTIKSDDGLTALHQAAKWGSTGLAKLLLSKGADVNARDKKGYTPLHNASAFTGGADTVRVLIANNADVNARESEQGSTPLHIAAYNFQNDTIEALIANDANVNAKDNAGATPLAYAMGAIEDIASWGDDPNTGADDPQDDPTVKLLKAHGATE